MGWVLVNSPPGEGFHFLGKEPHSSFHIWLLSTYYSHWPNHLRFAHSNSFTVLLPALKYKPWIEFFFSEIKRIPPTLCSVVNPLPESSKPNPCKHPSAGDKCPSLISIILTLEVDHLLFFLRWWPDGWKPNLGRFILDKSRKFMMPPNRFNGRLLILRPDVLPHEGFSWNRRLSLIELSVQPK